MSKTIIITCKTEKDIIMVSMLRDFMRLGISAEDAMNTMTSLVKK
jgi:hypothetical protein